MKNIYQASKAVKPVIPAIWPNRAIRRALRFGSTLPSQWAVFFDLNPYHRSLAKAQR